MTFQDLKLNTPLYNALDDLGYTKPTPIQAEAFGVVASGRDVVGIAQTGTGKTFAYLLPVLRNLNYSQQDNPRVLVLVPTRELVIQVVSDIKKLSKYSNNRVLGVYGGTNINTQKQAVAEGLDILVATPGRLYDLALSRVLQLKSIQKVIIDEVDVMLDLGFRHQLLNIFDILPERRQHIMFSATMTAAVDALIDSFFVNPTKIQIAVSGTPLDNINQVRYDVPNFYTKINFVAHVFQDSVKFTKVLIFVATKKNADVLFGHLESAFPSEVAVIHSNKTQNYRLRSIEDFRSGNIRLLVTTDVMARGLDIDDVSHVISFDTPEYPENYMHRIGRTGRAQRQGHAILLSTAKEAPLRARIETLMQMNITHFELPEVVQISQTLLDEEREVIKERYNPTKRNDSVVGEAFHEKKEKNKKVNLGGSYKRNLSKKYKKPKTRGDKNYTTKKKRRR